MVVPTKKCCVNSTTKSCFQAPYYKNNFQYKSIYFVLKIYMHSSYIFVVDIKNKHFVHNTRLLGDNRWQQTTRFLETSTCSEKRKHESLLPPSVPKSPSILGKGND